VCQNITSLWLTGFHKIARFVVILTLVPCSVYYPDRNQPITEGHEVLEKTLGGAPADLNLFGRISTYLTFKRGLLYGHTPAITDIVIIGKVLSIMILKY